MAGSSRRRLPRQRARPRPVRLPLRHGVQEGWQAGEGAVVTRPQLDHRGRRQATAA